METYTKLIFGEKELFAFADTNSTSIFDYINPMKQKDLRKILSNVPESVELIMVYGSALGDFVRNDSDLDLAVVSKNPKCYDRSTLSTLALDTAVDIKIFPSVDNLATQAENFFPTAVEIVKKGLPVYYMGKEVVLS